MKQAIRIQNYFLFILLFTSYGCNINNNSDYHKNDREKSGIKADVIFLIENSNEFHSESYNEDVNNTYISSYDDSGNKIQETTVFYSGNKIKKIFETLYKYEGGKLYEHIYNDYGENSFPPKVKYEYDTNGYLISKKFDVFGINSIQKFKYANQLLSETVEEAIMPKDFKSPSYKNVETYFYNKNNHIDSIVSKKIQSDGFVVFSKEYFDKNQLLIKSIGSSDIAREYKYNEKGDCVEKKEHNLKTNLVKITNFKYTYDKKDNWIEKMYFEEDKQISQDTRKIFYKGDDYINFISKYEAFKLKCKSNNRYYTSLEDDDKESEQSTKSYSNSASDDSNEENYQKPVREKPHKVTCYKCNGSGNTTCRVCNGTGLKVCGNCSGGFRGKEVCYICHGNIKVQCNNCGADGIYGSCVECKGLGYRVE